MAWLTAIDLKRRINRGQRILSAAGQLRRPHAASFEHKRRLVFSEVPSALPQINNPSNPPS